MVGDLEAAQYAADRAFRQHDPAYPENRFVAGELEARWHRALTRVAEFEQRIADHDATAQPRLNLAPISFTALAGDLQTVWSAPTTDARRKKRIVRTVIHEAMAGLDNVKSEIILTIHWVGGIHTQHRLLRRRRGQRNSTSADIVKAVRALALIARDDVIAGTLNRNGLRTGQGNRWTRERVTALRSSYRIPVYCEAADGVEPWLNLGEAAAIEGVAPRTLWLAVKRARSTLRIPWRMAPGSLAGLISTATPPAALPLRAKIHPRHPALPDVPSKVSSPQRHSEMCVVTSDCRNLR
jgi:hypothetical protein